MQRSVGLGCSPVDYGVKGNLLTHELEIVSWSSSVQRSDWRGQAAEESSWFQEPRFFSRGLLS